MLNAHAPHPTAAHYLLDNPTVRAALEALREAHEYASDLCCGAWDFPVELETLLRVGCSLNALRWLVRRGLVKHATPAADEPSALDLSPGGDPLTFPKGTCFILTDAGAMLARTNPRDSTWLSETCSAQAESPNGRGGVPDLPLWDGQSGELHYRGRLIKRFRNAASNQRKILEEFQRQRWPEELADPLPADRGVNRKQRLHDTIKNLNRGQEAPRLRFYGADAGHAVGWKPWE
jgi:hypothetical protein